MNDPELPAVPKNLYPYLNDIAERLFSRHAAIMIGSGLSKNAKPHSDTSPGFPDWSDLGDLFLEKLHHERPGARTRYLSVPALAHEVEAAVGRPALNQLLRDAIPDQAYEPAQLHKDLLTLPWQDVYTTNYDTLLERACESLSSQRYDVVLSQDSLVYSEKPRVVKLHGTLSSSETLIVTDEDYRCYPQAFAPFVNMVRQTLLENTLCLIGFSGDDPNFLRWVGWLHDNLGLRDSPKMYLIGLPDLSDSQKQLLARRNILVVDMSAYSDVGPDDHERALKRFVDYLGSREKDFNSLNWPDTEYDSGPKFGGDITKEIRERLPRRRNTRIAYPGWVVAPSDGRRSLWEDTRNWLRYIPNPEEVGAYPDLEFVFELVWRMEKSLCPIPDRIVESLEDAIDRRLPLAALDDAELRREGTNVFGPGAKELSRTEIRDMCNYVLLSLMRYYRQEGRLDRWKRCYDRMQPEASRISREHTARMHYERALFSLFELNPVHVERVIDEWPVDESLPFWEAKRGSLLAELGRVSDAVRILEKSVATIRSRSNLKPITTDYSSVSQESVAMLVLKTAQDALDLGAGKLPERDRRRREFAKRWQSLRQYKCDPWGEIELFETVLEREPRYTQYVTKRPAFEIGLITQTHSPMTYDAEALTAWRFLTFCEDCGIPFRIGNCTIAKKGAAGTLSRIEYHSPYYAMATLVRIGDEKAVERVFNREAMVGWSAADVDRLVDRYLGALDLMKAEIRSATSRWDQRMALISAKVIPEILSRLCCRCSREAKDRLVLFLQTIYESEDREKYGGIGHLAARLMEACSVEHRVELIPRLLEVPILNEYHNPIGYIELRSDWIRGAVGVEGSRVRELIASAGADREEERKWAVLTLALLCDWGIVVGDVADDFGRALWSRVNEEGFPEGTDFERSYYLGLPHPDSVEPGDLFRKWVAGERFPMQEGADRIRLSEANALCDEIVRGSRYLVWSEDEVCSIAKRLAQWWDQDNAYLEDSREDVVKEFRGRFNAGVDALIAVIAPPFDPDCGNQVRSDVPRLIREIGEKGLYVRRLECACLHLFPEWQERVLWTIGREMGSSSKDIVVDVLSGVRVMGERVRGESVDADKESFAVAVGAVALAIRWRGEAGLASALNLMGDIVGKHPWVICGDVEIALLEGLDWLAEETVVQAVRDPLAETNEGAWDAARKLAVRRAAVKLACALAKYYRDKIVPDAITRWQAVSRSEKEFAEVRNEWSGIELD